MKNKRSEAGNGGRCEARSGGGEHRTEPPSGDGGISKPDFLARQRNYARLSGVTLKWPQPYYPPENVKPPPPVKLPKMLNRARLGERWSHRLATRAEVEGDEASVLMGSTYPSEPVEPVRHDEKDGAHAAEHYT